MLRRAALAASLLVLFTVNVASAANANVTIVDFNFNNGSPTIGLGDSVAWTYPSGASHHTSSSVLPISTWGALSWSFAFNAPGGGSQTHVFHEAGTWSYHCLIHNFMKGQVNVQFRSSSMSGPLGTTFTLTLGDQALAANFRHDIQKKRNSGSFKTWQNTTGLTQTWKPAKRGTYQFRTRVTHTVSPIQSSGWSPVITITVS